MTGAGCGGLKNCQDPVVAGSRVEVAPQPGGIFEARLVVDVKAPWNSHSSTIGAAKLHLFWRRGSPATNPTTSLCQLTSTDRGETYVVKTGLTCAGAPYDFGTYSLRALVCQGIAYQKLPAWQGRYCASVSNGS